MQNNNSAYSCKCETLFKTDHILVHKTILNKFKIVEITQWAFSSYNGTKLQISNSKISEIDTAVCDSINASWEYYAKWNKPVTKVQILHYSTYVGNVLASMLSGINLLPHFELGAMTCHDQWNNSNSKWGVNRDYKSTLASDIDNFHYSWHTTGWLKTNGWSFPLPQLKSN